jgi:hypothetical protein
MSSGLRIWDYTGNLQLDTNYRLPKLYSSITRTISGVSTQSFPMPGIIDDGTWSIALYSNLLATTGISVKIMTGYLEIKSVYTYETATIVIDIFRS